MQQPWGGLPNLSAILLVLDDALAASECKHVLGNNPSLWVLNDTAQTLSYIKTQNQFSDEHEYMISGEFYLVKPVCACKWSEAKVLSIRILYIYLLVLILEKDS